VAVIRTILAVLVAQSVAALPAARQSVVPSVEMTMADDADMPCCPGCNTQDDFKSTVCALKCVALAGIVVQAMILALPHLDDGPALSVADDPLHGLARAPLTHPPSA
jgi:hypothetical protein